jgi:uridine kinase
VTVDTMSRKPLLVAVAGPSCSGKTTLARALAEAIPPAALLALDRYYLDLPGLSAEERAARNYDEPAAFDWPLFTAHLDALGRGEAVDAPVYDFATHGRAGTRRVASAPLVIVEGLMPWALPGLCDHYGLRVYVEADDALCLGRRVARDTAERGRTRASVEAQYEATVRPMVALHVRPQRDTSDLVVDGAAPTATALECVLGAIRTRQ